MLKKAQESAGVPVHLLLIVIAIAALAVIFFIYLFPKLVEFPEREMCRLSVIAKSETKVTGSESEIPLNCHTNLLDIKKDGIYKDGNIDVVFKRGENVPDTEDKIKKYVANQMYDCWYQFNEGQSDPWGDWGLGTTQHCVICADINFDSEFNEKIPKIDKFGEFLNTEKFSRSSKETYAKYLGGDIETIEGSEDLYIDTSQPHLVLYRLKDLGAGGGIFLSTVVGCGTGAGATAIANVVVGVGTAVWAAGTGIGCIVGFAGGVYHYIIGAEQVNLEAKVYLAPSDAVDKSKCGRIG